MRKLQVYITYDSDDILLINFICEALNKTEIFDAFYPIHDEYKDFPKFTNLNKNNIKNSDIILGIFSKISAWSDLIKEEFDYAKSLNKVIIPLVETSSKIGKISKITGTLVYINFNKGSLNKSFFNKFLSRVFIQFYDMNLSYEIKNKIKEEILEYANENWNTRFPISERLILFSDIISEIFKYMNYEIMHISKVFNRKEINLITKSEDEVIYVKAKLHSLNLKDVHNSLNSQGSADDIWLIANTFSDKAKAISKKNEIKLFYIFEFIKSAEYVKYKLYESKINEILFKRKSLYDKYEENTYLVNLEKSIKGFDKLLNIDHLKEELLQKYLENNTLLLDPLNKNIYVKHKLGSEYVTDFIIEKLNMAYVLVEIEPSYYKLYTKKGNQTKELRHAIKQIEDWQRWVANNIYYARNTLINILNPKGMIVIGRKINLTEDDINRLNYHNSTSRRNYEIHTYDDLIERSNILLQNLLRLR